MTSALAAAVARGKSAPEEVGPAGPTNRDRAMKRLLSFVAAGEGLTGVILLAYPPIVVRLLFDAEIAGAGVSMGRIAGIGLIGLAVACWPDHGTRRAFLGMLTYSLLAMLYLVWVGVNGGVGMLLWPAVAAHAGLSVLLVLAWWKERQLPEARG